MAGNKVTLEFAGDATKLAKESQSATQDIEKFGKAVDQTSKDMSKAGGESQQYVDKVGKLGAAVDGASTAIDNATAAVQGLADMQDAARSNMQRHERALNDVKQAQQDYNQALQDGKQGKADAAQAELDLEQADIDKAVALKEYNKAVKEHGKNSLEAKQAKQDMNQADQDAIQAQLDEEQAVKDSKQALIDAKGAQLDLNDAQKEANPPDMQKYADQLSRYAPLLSGLIGITGLVTAAQWAWNLAQALSPTTWLILGILVLIGVIVLIATKTKWFQKLWEVSWDWIKKAAATAWDFIKKIPGWMVTGFAWIAKAITAPFRATFNGIADIWNNTIGRLSWSVPGWVPIIGGNSMSVPNIPKFHTGGIVPGAPGSEMLAMVQAGETITPAGQGTKSVIEIRSGGSNLDDMLIEILSKAVRGRGGNVQLVLGGRNA